VLACHAGMRLTPDRTAALAEAAGLELPPERLEPVTVALDELLGLAESLGELPLESVEPLLGPPAWE
jgi:Asp-tRNA(Asn)/Glu-tRNA(Gln) amidotransferase C subunit